MKSIITYSDLPSGYKRRNIAEQIAQQRAIFNPVWKDATKNKEERLATYLPGLIEVMKDSMAISYDLFANDPELKVKLDKVKGALIRIWHAAQEADHNQQYTMNFSIHLHKLLAATIDAFRMGVNIKQSFLQPGIIMNEDNYHEVIDKMLQNYTKYNSYYNTMVIFVLHRNPDKNVINSHVGHKTFVDQFFHEDYSVNLMLFDVISNPQLKETKKEPHWGTQTGAYMMIAHDYTHCFNIRKYSKFISYGLHKFLGPIYGAIKYFQSMRCDNATTILYNGLFLMFHEIMPDARFSNTAEQERSISINLQGHRPINAIQIMVEAIKAHSIDAIEGKTLHKCSIGEFYYKFLLRDREFVLKNGTDLNGKPFLPMIQVNANKKRAFPIGRIAAGPLFIVEQEAEGIEYVLSSTAIPEDLRQERYKKMTIALQDGYNRFWNTFSALLEQCFDSRLEYIDRTYSSNACAIL